MWALVRCIRPPRGRAARLSKEGQNRRRQFGREWARKPNHLKRTVSTSLSLAAAQQQMLGSTQRAENNMGILCQSGGLRLGL